MVLIFSFVEENPLLHAFHFDLEGPFLQQLQDLRVPGHLTNVFLSVVLHQQVVLVVVFEEVYKFELPQTHEVFMAEADFVLEGGVESVQVRRRPSVLVVGGVQLDFLAADVELVGVVDADEVHGHDLVPVPEKDSVDQTAHLVSTQDRVSLLYLVTADLGKLSSTSFFVFFRFTMNYFGFVVPVSF